MIMGDGGAAALSYLLAIDQVTGYGQTDGIPSWAVAMPKRQNEAVRRAAIISAF